MLEVSEAGSSDDVDVRRRLGSGLTRRRAESSDASKTGDDERYIFNMLVRKILLFRKIVGIEVVVCYSTVNARTDSYALCKPQKPHTANAEPHTVSNRSQLDG